MRAADVQELEKQLETTHREVFDLRLRLATRQLANHRELPRARREIARLKTVLREKELGIR